MRVIKPSRLTEFWRKHAEARSSLERWLTVAKKGQWLKFEDIRRTFRSADEVKTASGKKVIVFNIGGNSFRLVCAAHYNCGKIFVLRFLTHAEYNAKQWKEDL